MPVMYNSFSPASSVTLALSSEEELVIVETDEEFAALEAFEHSGEELDLGFLFFTGGVMRTFT